jgi:Cu/Ag efflux protein CusF
MRKIITTVMALVFMSGIVFASGSTGSSGGSTGGSSSMSSSTSTTKGGATGGTGEEKTITGTVKSVNENQKQITIKGHKGNQVQYTLNDNTMIVTSSGQPMTIGELKSGSKVTITYTGTGTNAVVTKVQVQQGK